MPIDWHTSALFNCANWFLRFLTSSSADFLASPSFWSNALTSETSSETDGVRPFDQEYQITLETYPINHIHGTWLATTKKSNNNGRKLPQPWIRAIKILGNIWALILLNMGVIGVKHQTANISNKTFAQGYTDNTNLAVVLNISQTYSLPKQTLQQLH